jgi:hypothetical protein
MVLRAVGIIATIMAASGCASTAGQSPPAPLPSVPISQSGATMTMPASGLTKLDAFLKQAVAARRTGLLRVMVKLAERDGAESRVRALLTRRNRPVDKVLMDGRLVVTTLDTGDLVELAASDDVERISLDAVVKITGT